MFIYLLIYSPSKLIEFPMTFYLFTMNKG